jgi:hypothetical protein
MSKALGRFSFTLRMTVAAKFFAELQRERRRGNVCSETELRLRLAFRTLGRNAPESALTAAIGLEIDRVEREAATLRRMRSELFNSADPSENRAAVAEARSVGEEYSDTESWK